MPFALGPLIAFCCCRRPLLGAAGLDLPGAIPHFRVHLGSRHLHRPVACGNNLGWPRRKDHPLAGVRLGARSRSTTAPRRRSALQPPRRTGEGSRRSIALQSMSTGSLPHQSHDAPSIRMPPANLLIYLLRRDLRLEDNPILHALAAPPRHPPYTHLLPLYVFAAQQVEVSGFIPPPSEARSPYPEARSDVGGFWRCGPHRARFMAESVWDLKEALEGVGSGLALRVGLVGDVIRDLLDRMGPETPVGAIWMTGEEGAEEKGEEEEVRSVCQAAGIAFRLFPDEKYFIDDRDLPFQAADDLPDVFTTYRKLVEPLRAAPRGVLPAPTPSSLPPWPPTSSIPAQQGPFVIPASYPDLERAVLSPVGKIILPRSPLMPPDTQSAHPFHGGAQHGHHRLRDLVASGAMTSYKATRNGLLGTDYSTKLSAWLALGCLTARQVHQALVDFEDGTTPLGRGADGYGQGENEGTKSVRFELLWRDYMRLCTRKFRSHLFRLSGFRALAGQTWKSPAQQPETLRTLERFLEGTTGMGLIDASQRELYLTGYTSNRARQNVASFFAKHLQLDWRLGAEWYECMLVDYDVSSNWGNWQYVAGVGNDPRGEARVFNPVKQAFDYDPHAEYVKSWIQELRGITEPGQCFQAWTIPEDRREGLALKGVEWVERPLKKVNFVMGPGRHGGGGGGRGGGTGGAGRLFRGNNSRGGQGGSGGGGGGGPHPARGAGRGWQGGASGGGRYGGSSRPYGSGGRGGRGGPGRAAVVDGGGPGGREGRKGSTQEEAAAAVAAAAAAAAAATAAAGSTTDDGSRERSDTGAT